MLNMRIVDSETIFANDLENRQWILKCCVCFLGVGERTYFVGLHNRPQTIQNVVVSSVLCLPHLQAADSMTFHFKYENYEIYVNSHLMSRLRDQRVGVY